MAEQALGTKLPAAAKVATGDLQSFYSQVTGLNTELPKTTSNLENALRQFALWSTVGQIANDVKRFGEELGKFVGEGMADSLDKEGALIKAVEGVLINNPALAAKIKEGGAKAYADFASGLQGELNKKAIEIGLNTTFSDNQVAQGMSILLKSGVPVQDVMNGVADSMTKIAMVSGSDIPAAARHMVSLYNQFGTQLKTEFGGNVPAAFEHVADVVTNSLGSSGVDLNAFMNSLSYAGTVAALSGQSFSDTSAVLTLFAKSGIAGSKAGTGLRRIITNLTPSTDKAAEAIAAMTREIGGSSDIFYDAEGNMKSLVDVQKIMADTLAKFAPQDQIRLVQAIFGQYAIGQALVLANAEEFDNLAVQVSQAGTAERQVQAIMASGVGTADRYTEAINTLKETMGDTNLNYVTPLKANLADLIERYLTNAPASTQTFVNSLVGGTAVVAQLGGSALSTASNVGMMMAGFKLAGIDVAAMGAAALPVVGIIAAVAAAAALVYAAWVTNFGGFRDFVIGVWNEISPSIEAAMTTVTNAVIGAVQTVQAWWAQIGPSVEKAFANVMAVIAWFSPLWNGFWEAIKATVSGAWTIISGVIEGAWKVISGIFDFFVHLLSGEWGKLWDDILKILEGLAQIIVSAVTGLWQAIWGVAKAGWDALVGLFAKLWDAIKGPLQSVWDGVVGVWTSIKDWVVGVATAIWTSVSDAFVGVYTSTVSSFTNIYNAIKEWLGGAWDWVVEKFTSLPQMALEWGKNLLKMFVDGIMSGVKKVEDAVKSVANKVKDFLGFSSPTELGPASDSDRWAPNFVQMFVDGIEAGRPALQRALDGMAMDMRVGVAGGASSAAGVPIGAGGGGRSVSIVINYNGSGTRKDDDYIVNQIRRVVAMG